MEIRQVNRLGRALTIPWAYKDFRSLEKGQLTLILKPQIWFLNIEGTGSTRGGGGIFLVVAIRLYIHQKVL